MHLICNMFGGEILKILLHIPGTNNSTVLFLKSRASYQLRKILGSACAGNAGKVFPVYAFKENLLVSIPGMYHGTCVTHVPWRMSGLQWRGKRTGHSRRMHNPQCYVSGKRPMSDPLYFIFVYLIFMSLIVLYFLHSTSVLSFYVDVVLTLSISHDSPPTETSLHPQTTKSDISMG